MLTKEEGKIMPNKKYNTPAHKRAQAAFTKAQADRGLVRVQFWLTDEQSKKVKEFIKTLKTIDTNNY